MSESVRSISLGRRVARALLVGLVLVLLVAGAGFATGWYLGHAWL